MPTISIFCSNYFCHSYRFKCYSHKHYCSGFGTPSQIFSMNSMLTMWVFQSLASSGNALHGSPPESLKPQTKNHMSTCKDFAHEECSAQLIPQCRSRSNTNHNGILQVLDMILGKKIIFFISEDPPLPFLLKAVSVLLDI